MKIKHPYKDLENIPDPTKGDCPNCAKGYLFVDLNESFVATIHAKTFLFEVIVCDRCDFVRFNGILSESDVLKVESD